MALRRPQFTSSTVGASTPAPAPAAVPPQDIKEEINNKPEIDESDLPMDGVDFTPTATVTPQPVLPPKSEPKKASTPKKEKAESIKPAPAPVAPPPDEQKDEPISTDTIEETASDDDGIEMDNASLPSTGEQSHEMVHAEECSFEADATVLTNFLTNISMEKLITDAVITIKENSLFCAFSEPSVSYITGFVELPVVVKKQGRMVITEITKFRDIVKVFKGAVTVSYNAGKIWVVSVLNKKDKASISVLDESHIFSFQALANKVIDLPNKKIGSIDFNTFSTFRMNINEIVKMMDSAKAINLAFFKFIITAGNKSIESITTNGQDEFTRELSCASADFKSSFEIVFAYGLKELCGLFKNVELNFWIDPDRIIVSNGKDYYVIMSSEA